MILLRDKYDFKRALERPLAKIRGRIRGLATRFVLGKATRDADDLARVRGETYAGDELMQHYGFASIPVNGAEGVRVSVFSDGDHGVVVVLDDRRYRPTLADGEVAVYHKDGAIVHFKADGSIAIVPSGSGLVHVGADPGAEFIALATKVATELTALKSAISGAAVAGGDGGATFKSNILAALTAWPGDVAATKAKAT